MKRAVFKNKTQSKSENCLEFYRARETIKIIFIYCLKIYLFEPDVFGIKGYLL